MDELYPNTSPAYPNCAWGRAIDANFQIVTGNMEITLQQAKEYVDNAIEAALESGSINIDDGSF